MDTVALEDGKVHEDQYRMEIKEVRGFYCHHYHWPLPMLHSGGTGTLRALGIRRQSAATSKELTGGPRPPFTNNSLVSFDLAGPGWRDQS